MAVCSDCSAVNKTKQVISQLITNGWGLVFLWIPSHCGIPGNDTVDTLAKEALNLPSPEELTTYQQAVAEITRKSALLALDVHKQVEGKLGRLLENRIQSALPRSVFAANFASSLDMTTYSDA